MERHSPAPPKPAAPAAQAPLKPVRFEELREGDAVYYPAQKKRVVIAQTPDTPGRIPIRLGNLKLRVPVSELTELPADQKPPKEAGPPVHVLSSIGSSSPDSGCGGRYSGSEGR